VESLHRDFFTRQCMGGARNLKLRAKARAQGQ